MWKSCGNLVALDIGGRTLQANAQSYDWVPAAEPAELDSWERIKLVLAEKIPPQAYQNWVARTSLEREENGALRVIVPDEVTKDFLEQEYGQEIQSALRQLGLTCETGCVCAQFSGASGSRTCCGGGGRGRTDFRGQPRAIESEASLRQFCGGLLQSVRACGGARGGQQPFAQLQSAVHLRRRREWERPT